MNEDAELLRRYAESGSEEAFAEVVRRHLPLVYSAALRQLSGAAARAEDVAQQVFIDLARKAAAVARRNEIVAWLYTSTHYAAAKLKRAEARRQRREQEAQRMQEFTPSSAPSPEWEQLRPVLDEAMQALPERDREVLLLRFFQGQRLADIGGRFGCSEDAVRMRVDRALDKLRVRLARHEITSTAAALGLLLANQPVVAVPAGLAASVTGAAVAGSAAGGGLAFLALMSATKMQWAVGGLLLAGVITTAVWQESAAARLREEWEVHRDQEQRLGTLREENRALRAEAADFARWRVDEGELAKLRQNREVRAARTRAAQVPVATWQGQPLFEVGQLDQVPKVDRETQVRPTYPAAFRGTKEIGRVTLRLVIDANGRVHDVEALNASHQEFAEASIEAVKHWTFSPGRKNGQPVNTRYTFVQSFSSSTPYPTNPQHWW